MWKRVADKIGTLPFLQTSVQCNINIFGFLHPEMSFFLKEYEHLCGAGSVPDPFLSTLEMRKVSTRPQR